MENACLLYTINMTLLSLVLISCAIIFLGNKSLKIFNGIRLPSLPVSILYPTFALFVFASLKFHKNY